jgi:hypothetical protein
MGHPPHSGHLPTAGSGARPDCQGAFRRRTAFGSGIRPFPANFCRSDPQTGCSIPDAPRPTANLFGPVNAEAPRPDKAPRNRRRTSGHLRCSNSGRRIRTSTARRRAGSPRVPGGRDVKCKSKGALEGRRAAAPVRQCPRKVSGEMSADTLIFNPFDL